MILVCYSAQSLLDHHTLVWMVGYRMAGFVLSGSGIRVFVFGNMGLGWGGSGKYTSVCCLLEVPEGCSCQVNVLQCTLEGGETVVGKYIRWKYVPLGYCS